jgi:hypothetical protein
MDPLHFCKQMMAEYEEQWTEAHGHQERHPLKVKMEALGTVMERVRNGENLEQLIQGGCSGDDPLFYLLCADLRSRWAGQTPA